MRKKLSMFIIVLALLLSAVSPISAQQLSTVDAYRTTGQFMVNKAPKPSFTNVL
ncbi:hypothetical protein [Lysinibacillus xylanilyticus]|uniref:hypothetical protein n=1 Tax=Lysinibacillus xylanilyticus TaxID=582475 RepID=UPI0036D951FE